MPPRLLAFVLLTACTSRAPRPTEPVAAAAESAPASEAPCTLPTVTVAPLSQRELELDATPPDIHDARALLVGRWHGHAYSLQGVVNGLPSSFELGQPGGTAHTEERQTVCFGARGGMMKLVDDEEAGVVAQVLDGEDAEPDARGDCTPRSRTYSLRREPEAGNGLWLRVRTTGGCPGDASYGASYTAVYVVHRLDDDFLVLVDGATAAVSAYRRR